MPQDQAAFHLPADRAQTSANLGSLWRQFEANDRDISELQRRLTAPFSTRYASSAYFSGIAAVMFLGLLMLVGVVGVLIA